VAEDDEIAAVVANVEIVNKYGAFDGEEHGFRCRIYGGMHVIYGGFLTTAGGKMSQVGWQNVLGLLQVCETGFDDGGGSLGVGLADFDGDGHRVGETFGGVAAVVPEEGDSCLAERLGYGEAFGHLGLGVEEVDSD